MCVCQCSSVGHLIYMLVDVFMPVFVHLTYHLYVCLCVYVGVRPSLLSFMCVCVYV